MTMDSQVVDAVLVATNKRYPVEMGTSEDGNSSYTLYSDGWLEQSGVILSGFTSRMTVQLLKAFKDKNYTVLVNREDATTDTGGFAGSYGTNYKDKTASSFSISVYSPESSGAWSWRAEGFSI